MYSSLKLLSNLQYDMFFRLQKASVVECIKFIVLRSYQEQQTQEVIWAKSFNKDNFYIEIIFIDICNNLIMCYSECRQIL